MLDLLTIGDTKLDVFVDLGKKARVACDIDKSTCRLSMEYGRKIPVENGFAMVAGSAPNIAVGVRRLGKKTGLVSVVGNDATATLSQDLLARERIDGTHLRVDKKAKSSFSTILTFEGESTILAVHHPHTYRLPKTLDSKWIFVTEMGPNYKNLFRELVRCKQHGCFKLAINPGALQLEAMDSSLLNLIAVSDLLIVNRSEAHQLTQAPLGDVQVLLQALQKLGPKTVVLTDGQQGAYATEDHEIFFTPAFPARCVETTGAGDAFASGFLGALLHRQSLQTALAWGSINAGNVIQSVGGQAGLLTKPTILTHLTQHPRFHVSTL